jgi:hypothetical protein
MENRFKGAWFVLFSITRIDVIVFWAFRVVTYHFFLIRQNFSHKPGKAFLCGCGFISHKIGQSEMIMVFSRLVRSTPLLNFLVMKYPLVLSCIFGLLFLGHVQAQRGDVFQEYFQEAIMHIDSGRFALSMDMAEIRGERKLAFSFRSPEEVAEIKLYPRQLGQIDQLKLLPSGDFTILDSLTLIDNQYYLAKIQFRDLFKASFLRLVFQITDTQGKQLTTEWKLFQFTNTRIQFQPEINELYIGEEKVFEIVTNQPGNVKVDPLWTESEDIDYRVTYRNGVLRLHLIGRKIGRHFLKLQLYTNQAIQSKDGDLIYHLPTIQHEFYVKESRLAFLKMNLNDISLNDETMRKGFEVQVDYHPGLKLQKTYRIEKQELPGGGLVGEIFTRNMLSNDQVLCWMRVYNFHKPTDGYLYMKDGDEAKFVTNVSITPQTQITGLKVMRAGGEWTGNLNVFPGEIVEVRVEGQGLDKANLKFEGLFRVLTDSVVSNENNRVFTLMIPLTIYRNKITLYNNGEATQFSLNVREYQRPKSLDFVMVDYGKGEVPITTINAPVLFDKTIRDIVFSFDDSKIDQDLNLNGLQYLSVDVRVIGGNRQLLDVKRVDNIVVCPAENSARYRYYDKRNCRKNALSLNNFLSTKTHELDDWSKIEIVVSHLPDRYEGGGGFTQRIDIYAARRSSFDIDISFPAGLLTMQLNDGRSEGNTRGRIGSFGGISLAAIAQFTFYRPGTIAREKPYRFGAGIIAINAFNFNPDARDRDLAIVALGSVYPIRRPNRKLSFPLHAGIGYRINEDYIFALIGPGIRISF